MKCEPSKRRLYNTLSRLGIVSTPLDFDSNIYIDDHGCVMVILPDGIVSAMGQLSFCGEFICKTE